MSNRVDSVNNFISPLLGAITGGVFAWGEELLFTIILASVGGAASTLASYLVKKYLGKK